MNTKYGPKCEQGCCLTLQTHLVLLGGQNCHLSDVEKTKNNVDDWRETSFSVLYLAE
jgi:hypothetical protein